MDPLSLIGVVLACAAIIGGNALEGGHLESLFNGPAVVIVIGGTVGAVLIQTPVSVFLHATKSIVRVFVAPSHEIAPTIRKIIDWSQIARREGLLGLESISEREPDLFVRKGIQLLVDGSEPDMIRSILEVEVDTNERFDMQAAKVYEAMGGYSPTIGILGAVMGLIHVMQNLADPSRLGAGIATAFVATIYGVGLANLLLLPMASKLKALAVGRSQFREMVIEGIVSIAEGENPRYIETKLRGYLN